MSAAGQSRPNEKHRPNDQFVIRKRTLAKDDMNGRFWPIPACGSGAGQMAGSGHIVEDTPADHHSHETQDHRVDLMQFRFDAPVLRCF